MEVFNENQALDYLGGSAEFLCSVVRTLLAEVEPLIDEIEGHATALRRDKVEEIAHRLKGTLGTVGGERAAAAAAELESLCQTDSEDMDIEQAWMTFDLAWCELRSALNTFLGQHR